MTDRVLVVDDEPGVAEALVMLLESEGYECTSALNGAEGLERVRDWRPDLVVLDTMMPVMDGIAVVRALHADPATTRLPILLMSAVAPMLPRDEQHKIAGFFRKPFDVDRFLEEVRRILDRAREPAAPTVSARTAAASGARRRRRE